MRQIVTQPTHNGKILDVILTNLYEYYDTPAIVPPVPADNPMTGCPSDHSTVIASPLSVNRTWQAREYITKVFRPLPESGIREFGRWICSENWADIPVTGNPSEQVEIFQKLVTSKVDEFLPQKSLKVNPFRDKPFITSELKKLDRQIKREYRKRNKSKKYIELKHSFDKKYKAAAEAYLNKNVRSLKEDAPGKAYKSLKKLGAQPGDCSDDGSFSLISHFNENLSNNESIERIAQHFAQISQELPPLDLNSLPEDLKNKLDVNDSEIPNISDFDVYQKIRKSKKPYSCVPGDLPRKLISEFAPEIAKPAAIILRNLVKTGEWPKQWRVEYGTPIQKQDNPVNEDHLRIISLTNFLSKVCEQFVIDWLMVHIEDKLDWAQYGGIKGSSITHYLVEFINFILYNQDLKVPHAVIVALIDYSKAFNRINHSIIIKILFEMSVPVWLIRIVIGFLSERELVVRFKGLISSRKSLPAGSPQGTRLGLLIFLILINYAGHDSAQPNIGEMVTKSFKRKKSIEQIRVKYVDDMGLLRAVNLKENLIYCKDLERPPSYHNRTQHCLPRELNKLQDDLEKLVSFSTDHDMKINSLKSSAMIFNKSRKYDFSPVLSVSESGDTLDIVESYKLLGVIVRSDLKWIDNTAYICKKAYSRLWLIRRLKSIGASRDELIDVYQKQVRPILELAVPAWHPALTQQESLQIERVQKCALHIILGIQYSDYSNALIETGFSALEERRHLLCRNFAMKASKSQRFRNWFVENSGKNKNLRNTRRYKPAVTRTLRYEKSPIPFLTSVLNS